MRYLSFEIRNFKGIRRTVLPLTPAGSNVFTLIGLNESGKTTILEAINHHTPQDRLTALYESETSKETSGRSREEISALVPKRDKSDFSDDIAIVSETEFEAGEKEELIRKVCSKHQCKIDVDSIPDKFLTTRAYNFVDSDYKKYIYFFGMKPRVQAKGGRKLKPVEDSDPIWKSIADELRAVTPEIVYFPTFLFNQPDKIYLTARDGESKSNALYRQIIENIAASLPKPLDVQRHIVDRLINEETFVDAVFNIMGLGKSKQQQITAARNEISDHLTQTVFESWSKTFGGDFRGKEILINLDVDTENSDDPRVYASFEIKDRTAQYEIKERSLGFRWFFSFILFTLYRVSGSQNKPTLFLLDEPASNLHSRAQMQLLDSFPKITKGGNQIIYSTHSHYMINPDWLDQAFIVSNAAINYDLAIEDSSASRSHTDISVEKYRSFVGSNPDKFTYFQPVLDKLDVVPSRLDLTKPSVLVEGKGDYRILEYAVRVGLKSKSTYSIVPTRGATGMNELIGLFLGWAVPFVVCLDDDKEGRNARDTYLKDWGLDEDKVFTLGKVHETLIGKRIEGMLDASDLENIKASFGTSSVDKTQIQLYFSEALAKKAGPKLAEETLIRAKSFDELITSILG